MLVWVLILIASLGMLIAASERLTRAAQRLSSTLGVPGFVVGATVVAVGTSLPELFTSIVAALRGPTEIVAANIVGSNIFNATVIVGIAALIMRRLTLDGARRVVLLTGTALSAAFIFSDGVVTRIEGAYSLALGILALTVLVRSGHRNIIERFRPRRGAIISECVFIICAAVILTVAAALSVESVVRIGTIAAVPPSLVALFALAAGTSLPELVVSLTAARHRAFGISLGNVLGSNIFNATFIIGIPAILSPLAVGPEVIRVGILFLLAATGVLALLSTLKRITRLEGWLLLGFYLLFLLLVFNL